MVGVTLGCALVCPSRAARACANASPLPLAAVFDAELEPLVVAPLTSPFRKPLSKVAVLPPISAPGRVGVVVGTVPGTAMGETVGAMTL